MVIYIVRPWVEVAHEPGAIERTEQQWGEAVTARAVPRGAATLVRQYLESASKALLAAVFEFPGWLPPKLWFEDGLSFKAPCSCGAKLQL